jgi:hypothetical protein
LWRAAIVGTIFMFALAFFIDRRARGANGAAPPPAFWIGSATTAMLAFGLSAGATILAAGTAWKNRVRLWLHPRVDQAWCEGLWPPSLVGRPGDQNRAGRLVTTALVVAVVPPARFVVIAIGGLVNATAAGVLGGLLPIGGGIVILAVKDIVVARLVARTPAECWDDAIS